MPYRIWRAAVLTVIAVLPLKTATVAANSASMPAIAASAARRVILALGGAALIVVLVAGPATATLLNAPTLAPDHGQPGTLVHVTGFPDVTRCPSVRMFIAPVAGIRSFTDHRLSRLIGTVTYGLGLGEFSIGPLLRVPLFRFVVPALEPGRYMTYFTCAGAKNGWNALADDSLFRVDRLAPGATGPPPAPKRCPTLPTDAATLFALASHGPASPAVAAVLACFGRHEITIDAYVPRDVGIDAPGFPAVEPGWLSPYGLPQAVVQASRTSTGFGVRVPPRLQGCAGAPPVRSPGCPFAALAGRFVRLSGHFNDPIARTCHFVSPPPGKWPSPAELVTICRGEFVVDAVSALDGALPGTDTGGSLPAELVAPSGSPVVGFVVALTLTLLALVSLRRTLLRHLLHPQWSRPAGPRTVQASKVRPR